MNYFKSWLIIAKNIVELPNILNITCPRCKKNAIEYQYVGDINTRTGYLDIWCNSCLHGIHISRVKVPSKAVILSFDQQEEILMRIPNFIQDTPLP